MDKLRLDGFYLLGLAEDVVTVNGADNDEDDGEAGLEQAFNDRPDGDAVDGKACILLGNDSHGWSGKQGQEDGDNERDNGTLVTGHFKAHHQDNEQYDWDY